MGPRRPDEPFCLDRPAALALVRQAIGPEEARDRLEANATRAAGLA
jgi:hypothetical protein